MSSISYLSIFAYLAFSFSMTRWRAASRSAAAFSAASTFACAAAAIASAFA
jgi:hypothetical protein|tara:strand:+ start:1342 stop:1494 length:153 start_codon:yes stop_codon:yes gene_type:complete